MLGFIRKLFGRKYRSPAQVFRGQSYECTSGGFYRLNSDPVRAREFGDKLRTNPDEPKPYSDGKKQFDDLWLCIVFEYENQSGGTSERGLLVKSGFGISLDECFWLYGLDSNSNEMRTFNASRMWNVRKWGGQRPLEERIEAIIAREVRAAK